ncbi:leucine-rich repeat domain-containing protein [[Clostridium] innocuum]|uniref:leucine-rich repeat domain-containing protein n=1 Tax=Clostridium innocuum TaxID=1522 RepID=UPI000D6B3C40|nr:leucine-rich repeat domain-containing protein [[Clostridium] innocuum]PWJ12844.1 leucine rich repeat (LRR) protein [[Clostridium] innocuum]SSA47236.1 Leucine rich repeat-containing protein [[Clostridium] innocuum]
MFNIKKGFISIEYILLASIVIVFGISLYVYFFPDNVREILNKGGDEIARVTNQTGEFSGYGDVDFANGNNAVYPDSGKWNEKSDFTYTSTASSVTITGYLGSKKDIIIPEKIDDIPVTELSANAFASKAIKSVRIPKSIMVIGENCFANNELVEVIIPNGIKRIGAAAFMSNQITTLVLSNSVEMIEDNAFKNNILSTFDSASVKVIGIDAFYNNKLGKIRLRENLTLLSKGAFMEQGGLSGKAGTVMVEGEESRFNTDWGTTFDAKFESSRPD